MAIWLKELDAILEELGLSSEEDIIMRPCFSALFNVNGAEASRLIKAFGGAEIGIERGQLMEVVLEMIAYSPETESQSIGSR